MVEGKRVIIDCLADILVLILTNISIQQVELMSRYRTRLTLVSVLLTSSAEPKENYVTTTELEKSLEQVSFFN